MRLFVALIPPAAALDDLAAACAPFRAARGDLRWAGREQWHVTLAFLGAVDEEGLPRLLPRLERAARRHAPFTLALSGAGAFPGPARASVLWCGLSGDRKALAELAMSVAAGARRAGMPAAGEGRPFRPHLTLARCRGPADIRPVVSGLSGYRGPAWAAGDIRLIRSTGGPAPRYTGLGAWYLGSGATPG